MGAEFSSLDQLNKNVCINRLVNDEHIDENDPFWNQLLSFTINLPLTKANSKKLDENIALSCQKFHQNNPKSGNYSSLIRVFTRRANETRKMAENKLMILHTSNALFIIRCITKYMIEIENESVLLEQMNFCQDELKVESEQNPDTNGDNSNNQNDYSTDSSTASPKRLYNPNKNYRKWKSKPNHESTLLDSQENSIGYESDSDIPQNIDQNRSNIKKTDNILYLLVKNILQICTEVPVKFYSYNLHLEALNTLLILLSSQMYSKTPAYESVIFDIFMQKMDRFVSDFVKALLKNIIQQMPPPSTAQNLSSYLSNESQNQRSFMSSVASGLWSVMTLGLGSAKTTTDQQNLDDDEAEKSFLFNLSGDSTAQNTDDQLDCSSRYLAWQSCHILLILSNNCTNESLYNPYRLALFHFTDTQNTPTNLPNSEPLPWFSIDFSKLFQMFTCTVHTDQYSLLLYMLLHRNQHFKMFILSRLQIDLLVMPLLKVIFTAPDRNSHHIYMTLIIILILSEDDIFNKTVHTIPIKKLTWYTERSLSEISLGGLLILVLIRTIQFNMTRMRDKYLHTNCLAALANMSSKFQNLHPYVCQRINSLFNMLTRKRTKIITQINEENSKNDEKNENSNKDLLQDLSIIEELMKTVLEIINSCLTNNLHHNSDLIYSILYHKTIYLQFRDHPTFQDLTLNIDTIITRFSLEIENVEDKTIENLRELITMGAKQFSRERFRKFPELKFKYVEEDQPEEFFVPYVWSLVYKYSNLYWIDHSVDLFNSEKSQS